MHGIICMWSGTLDDIPDGWALCDGTNGTPNLGNRFIRSAVPACPPGRTGGASTHWHPTTVSEESHYHSGTASSVTINLSSGSQVGAHPDHLNWSDQGSGHEHVLNIHPDTHRHVIDMTARYHNPAYYALAFIMKL